MKTESTNPATQSFIDLFDIKFKESIFIDELEEYFNTLCYEVEEYKDFNENFKSLVNIVKENPDIFNQTVSNICYCEKQIFLDNLQKCRDWYPDDDYDYDYNYCDCFRAFSSQSYEDNKVYLEDLKNDDKIKYIIIDLNYKLDKEEIYFPYNEKFIYSNKKADILEDEFQDKHEYLPSIIMLKDGMHIEYD